MFITKVSRQLIVFGACVFTQVFFAAQIAPANALPESPKKAGQVASRTIHFPTKASVGRVFTILDGINPVIASDARGKFFGPACGTLTVPRDAKLILDLDPTVVDNPGVLKDMDADCLFGLRARYTECDDACVEQFCRLTSLFRLDINECEVTDSGAAHLSKLKNIERIAICTGKLHGQFFKNLQGLSKLKSLDVSNNPISEASMVDLARLANLIDLDLASTHVTDSGISHLTDLKKLNYLNLNSNRDLTGKGIAVLKNCPSLKVIEVRFTGAKAADMLALKGLHLTHINLTESELPIKLEKQLLATFPGCKLGLTKRIPRAEDQEMFAPIRR